MSFPFYFGKTFVCRDLCRSKCGWHASRHGYIHTHLLVCMSVVTSFNIYDKMSMKVIIYGFAVFSFSLSLSHTLYRSFGACVVPYFLCSGSNVQHCQSTVDTCSGLFAYLG